MTKKEKCDNLMDISRLKELIDTRTREGIAERFGCDASLITKHYNGSRTVTIDYLIKYAIYFNVSADYLLGLTDTPTFTDTDESKIVRTVCDYTVLDEKSVERLNLAKVTIPWKAEHGTLYRSAINHSIHSMFEAYFFGELAEYALKINETMEFFSQIKHELEELEKKINSGEINLSRVTLKLCDDTVTLKESLNDIRYKKFCASEALSDVIDTFSCKEYNALMEEYKEIKEQIIRLNHLAREPKATD